MKGGFNMKNKKILGALVIFSIAILSLGIVSAFGLGQGKGQRTGYGMMSENLSEEEIANMQIFQESLQKAIEENDFEEWKSLMESQLTQKRFDKIVESYSDMSKRKELKEKIQQAWKDKDYDTLKELRTQMSELMPEKAQMKENSQGDYNGKPMSQNQRNNFFQKFKFW